MNRRIFLAPLVIITTCLNAAIITNPALGFRFALPYNWDSVV